MGACAHTRHTCLIYDVTLHYIIKLSIVAKVKTVRSTMAQVTQQCQDMTAEISVSSDFDVYEVLTLLTPQAVFYSSNLAIILCCLTAKLSMFTHKIV